jgi:bacteriocin-like protein
MVDEKKNKAVELSDDDLEQVSGGYVPFSTPTNSPEGEEEEVFWSSKKSKTKLS